MIFLSIGDIVGAQGIDILKRKLPEIIKEYKVDFVVANIENAAEGLGIDFKTFDELESLGLIDCYVLRKSYLG